MPSSITETPRETPEEEEPALPSLRKPPSQIDANAKWIETDGLGGFACGTISGILTHRSQGLVVASKNPPLERYVLVNGLEVTVATPDGDFPLIRRRRAGEEADAKSEAVITGFETRPWPKWTYSLGDNLKIEHEFFIRKGMPVFALTWKLTPAIRGVQLRVRPLFSGRRLDQLQSRNAAISNAAMNFEPHVELRRYTWELSDEAPSITLVTDGAYDHDPSWYKGVTYRGDMTREGPATEDLACPGEFSWDLGAGRAHLIFDVNHSLAANKVAASDPASLVRTFRNAEMMRRKLIPDPLQQIAGHYIVKRKRDDSLHLMASYPQGSQRVSDALVAMRGICLSSGRLEIAQKILKGILRDFSGCLLPSLLSEYASSEVATFDSPDPTLWFILTAHEFLEHSRNIRCDVEEIFRDELQGVILNCLTGFEKGNAYGMFVQEDGLLAFLPPFSSHARSEGELFNVATQALWLNAVSIGAKSERHWKSIFSEGCRAFAEKFWFEGGGYLCDTLRNESGLILKARQVLAVGGLPVQILDEFRSSLVLQLIEEQLWTPYGLRVARENPPAPVCSWLLGPFVEAWFNAHQSEEGAVERARKRFIEPWKSLLNQDGLGHIGEASADPAHSAIPFYAPATAELLRILRSPRFDPQSDDESRGKRNRERRRG